MEEKKEGESNKINRQMKDQKSPHHTTPLSDNKYYPLPPAPAPPLLSLILFFFWSPVNTNDPKNLLSPHFLFSHTRTTFTKLVLPPLPPVRPFSFPFIKNNPSN
jgi:hypothetical protein